MNEDIVKKLIKQATEDILGVRQVDQKLYTELVVNECAAVADKTQLVDRQLAVSVALKEHFGLDNEG